MAYANGFRPLSQEKVKEKNARLNAENSEIQPGRPNKHSPYSTAKDKPEHILGYMVQEPVSTHNELNAFLLPNEV